MGLNEFTITLSHNIISEPVWYLISYSLQFRHNERDGISNHWRLDCLLKHLFRRGSKKTPKLRFTALFYENPPVTGGFLSQRASNAENVFIWWRHMVNAQSIITDYFRTAIPLITPWPLLCEYRHSLRLLNEPECYKSIRFGDFTNVPSSMVRGVNVTL